MSTSQQPALLDFEEKPLAALQQALAVLLSKSVLTNLEKASLEELRQQQREELKKLYRSLTHWQRTLVARHQNRPQTLDYIALLFENFIELQGDRYFGDDPALVGGLAAFEGRSVVVVGHQKGRGMRDHIKRNHGMAHPEGYRKAQRLFKLANKFQKPIITFVDTPGAYPGKAGEERGQAEAIASNLKEMFGLQVPVLSVIIGEGGSGGAIGIAVANHIMMLENSIYSVISPEACSSILWRDASRKEEAAASLKNDPKTALKFGLIDEIVKEPVGGAHRDWNKAAQELKKVLSVALKRFDGFSAEKLTAHREKKFAKMGQAALSS